MVGKDFRSIYQEHEYDKTTFFKDLYEIDKF